MFNNVSNSSLKYQPLSSHSAAQEKLYKWFLENWQLINLETGPRPHNKSYKSWFNPSLVFAVLSLFYMLCYPSCVCWFITLYYPYVCYVCTLVFAVLPLICELLHLCLLCYHSYIIEARSALAQSGGDLSFGNKKSRLLETLFSNLLNFVI